MADRLRTRLDPFCVARATIGFRGKYAGSYGAFGVNYYGVSGDLGLGALLFQRGNDVRVFPIRDEEIKHPAQMILIGDSILGIGDNLLATPGQNFTLGLGELSYGIRDPGTILDINGARPATRTRHNGRWNAVFTDAHLETLRMRQLF